MTDEQFLHGISQVQNMLFNSYKTYKKPTQDEILAAMSVISNLAVYFQNKRIEKIETDGNA